MKPSADSIEIRRLAELGYSAPAIAMHVGGPVGSTAYYKILKLLGYPAGQGCPNCGTPCFGTGDCNCSEE